MAPGGDRLPQGTGAGTMVRSREYTAFVGVEQVAQARSRPLLPLSPSRPLFLSV